MKKFTYIIAALCVVAIGTAIFVGCEKENENTFSNKVNTDKIQKEINYPSFENIDDPGIYYIEDSIDQIVYTLPDGDTIIREEPWGVGSVEFYSNNKTKKVHCNGTGGTCGNAVYFRNGVAIAHGIWAIYQDPCNEEVWRYYFSFNN